MNPLKILLPVLVLLGLGLGVWLLQSGHQDVALPSDTPSTPVAPPVEPPPIEPAVAQPDRTPVETPPERTVVDPTAGSVADAEQGIVGRVLQPNGVPAASVDVFLLQSTQADPLKIYLANKMRQKIEPVAQVRTETDGTFRIGVAERGQKYDLRVITAEYPELHHKSIVVRDLDWYDTGDLVLEVGGIVQGRVLDETGNFPIAGAHVFLTMPGLNHQMLPTPGRERGLRTETDNTGFFRYTNAPREGVVTLGAEAAEYAYSEKTNLQIKPDQVNEFTIELARGQPIAGVVVDKSGKPIGGATINATAQSAKLPQTATAASANDGRFRLPMMRPGPYQLAVSAPNFEDVIEKPVFAGNEEVTIVLEQRGLVNLRVLSARGTPIRNYTVGLKRYFPNNPGSIGKVPEFRDRRVTPGDYKGDYAQIRNVPNGEFVFQIIDNEHAKTLSPPFTMDGSENAPSVEVRLTNGASITGIIVDDRGSPVPGATVATDMNGGLAIDTGFFEMFRSFLPDKHTSKSVQTDGGGRFVLNRLAFADYMVRVSHPDFCESTTLDIKLESDGEMRDVGTIQLRRGAIIEGTCTVNGRPSGQIKVMIGPPNGYRPDVDAEGRPVTPMFSASAITNGDGIYRFLKRVPPGTYKIHAFKEAGGDDVFGRFKQMKETERQLVIAPGQEQSVQNFNLSN
ncbi:MAG: carboxypeptidase-like regulatory domain-containing protein [Planctomycetota bacterium]